MRPLRLAVIGWGRLGQACTAALQEAPDLALAGVVRRAESLKAAAGGSACGAPLVSHPRDLETVDAALVCVPAESVPGTVQALLQMRMPVVECASFEDRALLDHHERIAHLATRHRVGAVVGAGWNPGVLPQLRQLFELLIPKGQTRQLRHLAPGLHHTAAAEGVGGPHASLLLEARVDELAFCARMMCDGARALASLPHRAWRYSPFGLVPLFESSEQAEQAPAARHRTR